VDRPDDAFPRTKVLEINGATIGPKHTFASEPKLLRSGIEGPEHRRGKKSVDCGAAAMLFEKVLQGLPLVVGKEIIQKGTITGPADWRKQTRGRPPREPPQTPPPEKIGQKLLCPDIVASKGDSYRARRFVVAGL